MKGAPTIEEVTRYYALCVEDESGEGDIAFLDLGKDEELGQLVGMAVYTTPDGQAQREDLNKYRGRALIAPASHEELLEAEQRALPTSVFVDGKEVAGSVFRAHLMDELGIPIHRPRLLRPDAPEP